MYIKINIYINKYMCVCVVFVCVCVCVLQRERLCYDHIYRGIFVVPIRGIYQVVSLEALLQPVH